ncbi:MAG: inner membrane CreD family protein [Deltaproteobacteria bacterium]|nr:inner membrane CreD family protein [Deltaproteobacteria bacterium]
MKRLIAIAGIWFACSVAWMVLGGTLVHRTDEASSPWEVQGLWGPELEQHPLRVSYTTSVPVQDTETYYDDRGNAHERTVTRMETREHPVALGGSEIGVRLDLEHRQRGLAWFATYEVGFDALYRIENDTGEDRQLDLLFPLSSGAVVYDGLSVERVDEGTARPIETTVSGGDLAWEVHLAEGEVRTYAVRYRSRGLGSWHYRLGGGDQTRTENFSLVMRTNFEAVDFPLRTLSPSSQQTTATGWEGQWTFDSLLASKDIGVVLPQLPSPGPIAARITFFAPIGLLFFFFVVGVLATAGQVKLHPMHFFMIGCGFFAFHLLFAYLVDHLAIAPSFAIASGVSLGLVTSYTRLFTGWRFALAKMALPQALYLVLFSITFFWQGFTGLAITVGAILTLFVMMQITGRTDWKLEPPRIDPDPARPAEPPRDPATAL